MALPKMRNFKYWCYKVLPLVYDNSLSYYELLDKVVAKMEELVKNYNLTGDTIESIQKALQEVQDWIDKFDTSYLEELIAEYLARMIYVRITDAGYIVYYIPKSWSDIKFNTTGLDITNEQLSGNGHVANYDYGHLVLSMWPRG